MTSKYIFIVGGVMSSVGKGVAAAAIGKILQSKGYKVANIKADMYVNIDAGTIRPAEHGEVFVGEDGIEADQDLGNYERFTDQVCTADNYITTGQVYQEIIRRERNLEFGGEDVEVVPDIPNEIIRRIKQCQKKNKAEIVIIEIGGTVGEYQVLLFLEAARMMKAHDAANVFTIMVSYLPTPILLGEQKSKPTQYAIRTLNSAGIQPDFILCRADKPVTPDIKRTISTVCSLPKERIISAPDVYSIYDIPVNFEKENFGEVILRALGLKARKKDMRDWKKLAGKIKKIKKEVTIGIVGKYFNFKSCKDTYISVIESINHASWHFNFKPKVVWLEAEKYEQNKKNLKELDRVAGIIVPGGFGQRGSEGMILAAEYARKNKMPYFGLCLGMQILTISFARNVLGLKEADSTEFNPKTKHPVISTMEEQKNNIQEKNYGATMRLGAYEARLAKDSLAFKAYQQQKISERHRHRYEFNNAYRKLLAEAGMRIAGINQPGDLVEIIEIIDHPWMVGVQFHPEFTSRPLRPNPLFRDFVRAAIKRQASKK
ncbi:CTP synthase [Candidatus Kuenenbacteria bacterium CG_4_9_14_3_um_filter_39_14]|uniref:CTP synthase n=5 Tax=Candidatus Kueneniibacteriota TaxID=1752740 RepID=A0A2M7IKY5_9BACT|nr:CTP synthase [Candidatus Kuenenbacteria bacterium]OIP56447.1 MAG: CTP synthase [Candidatus Kuenenbacteria bacterium CG2_30_39_24]PIP29233.1 MAG: CTP synthetase [Candidatus Kuenenbacteria bacterium CG23_combo_of_CG06-09_8_20_14_all_39_39]PIR80934.1 MAG: CTP synthase [Candidatus Kuenenbacteria bacterium CG10_big_fil_rev_8_21_14_0_10_39_14]PIW95502.1 MAG: CTP synthase [Candidatus Kuenenbacteria bacterium CG_4_8_14_3_um_filter_39_15]PJA92432.1 MAG: CTP synthase [Candidatus Kuenenbacteria bacter